MNGTVPVWILAFRHIGFSFSYYFLYLLWLRRNYLGSILLEFKHKFLLRMINTIFLNLNIINTLMPTFLKSISSIILQFLCHLLNTLRIKRIYLVFWLFARFRTMLWRFVLLLCRLFVVSSVLRFTLILLVFVCDLISCRHLYLGWLPKVLLYIDDGTRIALIVGSLFWRILFFLLNRYAIYFDAL